jgi:predicted negative regulator of RcsB-dependent stress response
MNKNFWKFVAGFLGIVALAILTLFGFQYWQNYKEEQEIQNLIKAIQKKEAPTPPFENPLRSSP